MVFICFHCTHCLFFKGKLALKKKVKEKTKVIIVRKNQPQLIKLNEIGTMNLNKKQKIYNLHKESYLAKYLSFSFFYISFFKTSKSAYFSFKFIITFGT